LKRTGVRASIATQFPAMSDEQRRGAFVTFFLADGLLIAGG